MVRPVILVQEPRSLWVHQSANGCFRRVGHAKRSLRPDALARLFQQRSQARIIRFDEQEVPGCTLDDFDALLVRRFVREAQGGHVAQLLRLHLLRDLDGEAVPTVAGVVLCTEDPARWLRNAEILAVAHAGTGNDPDAQLDAREIRGPLDRQVLDAFRFVERNMTTPARTPLGRVEYPQYARIAVFEAIVNAVAHRDYSLHNQRIRLFLLRDRLESHSPGGLPSTLSLESMTRLSGVRPVYEQIGDLELCLTIFATAPPPPEAAADAAAGRPGRASARQEIPRGGDLVSRADGLGAAARGRHVSALPRVGYRRLAVRPFKA
jgi:predicted HTH transcriptional regulator